MKAVHEAEVNQDMYKMARRADAVRQVCEDLERKIEKVENNGVFIGTNSNHSLYDYTTKSLKETVKTLVLKELNDNLNEGHEELKKLLGGNYNGE